MINKHPNIKAAVLPPKALEICTHLKAAMARPIVVGGWVRDRLLGLPTRQTEDIDIEIFHISFTTLLQHLKKEPHIAFPHFGILRLGNIDLSLPRTEQRKGPKYNDFYVQIQPGLSFEDACQRRDFTTNAMGWDPFSREILDPFHGIKDIEQRQLRPVSKAFTEDSYRVLRAAQLIARFNFTPDQQLLTLCTCMDYHSLSKTHILKTKHVLNAAPCPKAAFQFLEKIHWQPIIDILKD